MAKASKFDAADYLKSPQAIADYLSEAFETGDEKFRRGAWYGGGATGMSGVANETGLARGPLSFAQQRRPPELATAMKVLDAFDLQLVVKPKEKSAA